MKTFNDLISYNKYLNLSLPVHPLMDSRDTKTKKLNVLNNLMPQLKEGDMAEMRPIEFKS
ncbi:hypothetical protein AAEU33_20450 [Chryseobacterium sp. Chry.R1]|uniref:hypothetical protein n=1 Tax=Chryseobacterium sp. Chry.R1 TaxID=3139392 RepID=UPI0031F8A1AE